MKPVWCGVRTYAGAVQRYFAIGWAAMALLLGVFAYGTYEQESDLHQRGVRTTAEVVAVERSRLDVVTVRFPVGGGSRTVRTTQLGEAAVGKRVAIRYDPSDPENVGPAAEGMDYGAVVILGSLAVAALGGFLATATGLWRPSLVPPSQIPS